MKTIVSKLFTSLSGIAALSVVTTLVAFTLVVSLGGAPNAYAQPLDSVQSAPAPQLAQMNLATQEEGVASKCVTCHYDDEVKHYFDTPHAMRGDPRTPFGTNKECATCHGDSDKHLEDARNAPDIVYTNEHWEISPVQTRVGICLGCHENGLRMNWKGSQHMMADVACNDCHTIKASKDPLLVRKTQPQQCFRCHTEQRAQFNSYSRHPIREGVVVCADCHNPHGTSGPRLLKEDTVVETCYACHTEKRGPYLWEHAPVTEDCRNCHNPHGSNNMRLLHQRPPHLCLQCHIRPHGGDNSTNPTDHRHIAYGCLNCHVMIHGSNHPSGRALQR